MTDSKFVVGLREVLWDMFPKGKRLGGAPANFAYHAAQFGHEGLAVSAIGLKMVILTKGVNGSIVLWKGGHSFQGTPKVKVVSAVGAGDSFTGSFIGAYLNGASIPPPNCRLAPPVGLVFSSKMRILVRPIGIYQLSFPNRAIPKR